MRLKKQIVKNADYGRSARLAWHFILTQGINSLPVDPFLLAQKNNWEVIKATDIERDWGFTIYYILNYIINSGDGTVFYCKNTDEYKIIYNDLVETPERIRWTIMHEIGHIVLGHHNYEQTKIARGGIKDAEHDVLEAEANFFAGLVLAPPIILLHLGISSKEEISDICWLSREASKNRFRYFKRWKKHPVKREELFIKNRFKDFLDREMCENCGYWLISEEAVYCPICGQKLKWGKGNMKYKDGIELNEKGRAVSCPQCDNEDISEGDDFCKICGAYLYQKCTGIKDINGRELEEPCDVLLDSNARYCTQCGEETTFYENGFLNGWQEEKEELENEDEELTDQDETAAVSEDQFDLDDDFDVPF